MAFLKINPVATPAAQPRPVMVVQDNAGKPLVRPELVYMLLALGLVVVGWLIGIALDDENRPPYQPPQGVDVFAVFFIAAFAIERLLEPIAPFFGTTTKTNPPGDTSDVPGVATRSKLLKARDAALFEAAEGSLPAAEKAAWAQALLDQVRRNTSTIWALGAFLGMIAAGELGLMLLHAVDLPNVSRNLDILVTGLAIGGGTKSFHDLITNVRKSKEEKETPQEAGGKPVGT
jgi:hypothetical protein